MKLKKQKKHTQSQVCSHQRCKGSVMVVENMATTKETAIKQISTGHVVEVNIEDKYVVEETLEEEAEAEAEPSTEERRAHRQRRVIRANRGNYQEEVHL